MKKLFENEIELLMHRGYEEKTQAEKSLIGLKDSKAIMDGFGDYDSSVYYAPWTYGWIWRLQ
jgi:hypothetical protein